MSQGRFLFRTLGALLWALAGALVPSVHAAGVREESHTDAMHRAYFLYLPERIEPQRTYWLFVGVHGAHGNGKGACGMTEFVAVGNCIVAGPSFPETYQGLGADSDKQLIDLAAALGKTYKLHERLFVAGFSGGAQFAHRFALAHPDAVIGCAAHSAGSWATGDIPGDVQGAPKAAAALPVVISCGLNDLGIAMPEFPIKRLDFARKFEATVLQKDGFLYRSAYIPNTGHTLTRTALLLTRDCYDLATTGLAPDERQRLETLLVPITNMVRMGRGANAGKALDALPDTWAKARALVHTVRRETDGLVPGWTGGTAFKDELAKRADEYLVERVTELRAALAPSGAIKK